MPSFQQPELPDDSLEVVWDALPDQTTVTVDDNWVFEVTGSTIVVINNELINVSSTGYPPNDLRLTIEHSGTHVVVLEAPGYDTGEFEVEVE